MAFFLINLNFIEKHHNSQSTPLIPGQPPEENKPTATNSQTMCTAKAQIAKCGHTVDYEIMIPCKNHPGSGPPCAAWDENQMNKVLLTDYPPVCIKCHLQKEKMLCRQYVDAERDLVRFAERRDGSPKEIWEERLRNGVRMQADVYELDGKVGREGAWREDTRRFDWRRV
ncbi:hypothetical protein HO133_005280 [Letharia lupina]|uniref:Uncharacterized protein n=1 Tax=Letharia lupina TaxID=560253 RepID=A0A8H6C8J0_9LECA|nr:uncharacterized protein HO133_005280 [Letharia lupina]KAF6218738.1 hypothetical protein HO133_005280 [Letharia lupina]